MPGWDMRGGENKKEKKENAERKIKMYDRNVRIEHGVYQHDRVFIR